ncbi:hypothetical protein GIB67_011777 [Kingdonia uniflora]|uniref:Uncharacterized protein n=1 Tax=Kingdonia uniflora TaxID=39325 RepID=A0A7J7NXS1_9MAGN|nr:hypothetical protein GIB67_011777 [Kingdonia uniflora]
MLDLNSRSDIPDSWSVRLVKMHNHHASRRRPIDEEIEEFKASISGRAPIDEGNDVEVLDVITEAPLSMVLSAKEVAATRRRRTIIIEDSDEEEAVWGEKGDVGPSGGGEGDKVRRVRLGIIWNLRIINALPKVFPFTVYTFCAFYISNNIKATLESTRIAFWMATEALTTIYFDKHMNYIRNTDPVGLQYILSIPKETWSNLYIPKSRYGVAYINYAKSWNNVIVKVRDLLIHVFIEELR